MFRALIRVILAPVLAGLALLIWLPGFGLAMEFLVNPGLNDPGSYADTGRDWRDFDEKVAYGWNHYYVAEGTYEPGEDAPKLHWMSSQQFAQAFGGLDYYREGNASQVIWSSYDFDAGIYQQVGGLAVGQDYAFEIGMASYWRGSGYPVTDGKIKKCVGIDPTGGTDPTASSVIWDWDNCDLTDKTWPYLDMAVTAQAATMTVFARIQSPDNESYNHVDLNYVFIDDGRLALAPTVDLSVPAASDTSIELQWSADADPDWTLQGVEVQYQDNAEGVWYTIQGNRGKGTDYVLTGLPGHTYTVRARAWQEQGSYDLHGVWVEKQVQVGGAFVGYVWNHFGVGVSNAVVSTLDADTLSGSAGFYALQPSAYGQTYTLTVSASGHRSPPRLSASVPDETSLEPVDFTLKPINDAITNGDFESDTSGWDKTGPGGALSFSGGHRSGDASLELAGSVTLSQAVAVAGFYNPGVSFWHKPALSEGDTLEVSLEGEGALASASFTSATPAEWQHFWLPLDLDSWYTGTLTLSFHLSGGQVFVDEVSLGNGPWAVYLPITLAN